MLIFLKRGVKQVIVTLGKHGSLYVSESKIHHVPCKVVEAVDTTGAGDCYIGSLAFFISHGDDIIEAIKKASDIATRSVQKPGTQSSFPYRDELPANFFKNA